MEKKKLEAILGAMLFIPIIIGMYHLLILISGATTEVGKVFCAVGSILSISLSYVFYFVEDKG
jgi:hypothetical protein